jgi:hypothetical protein
MIPRHTSRAIGASAESSSGVFERSGDRARAADSGMALWLEQNANQVKRA